MASLSGDEWKNVRTKFSPIFTSGKLKSMMGLFEAVTEKIVHDIEKKSKNNEMFEMKDMMGKFSMDSIASCAFGMDAQSFTNPKSEFVKMAKNIFTRSKFDYITKAVTILPFGKKILTLLNVNISKQKETEFFIDVIKQSIERRRKTLDRRNDMVDMMVELLDEPDDDTGDGKSKMKLGDDYIVATALIILVAGYDTTAQALTYACYHLARNEELQRKLQVGFLRFLFPFLIKTVWPFRRKLMKLMTTTMAKCQITQQFYRSVTWNRSFLKH